MVDYSDIVAEILSEIRRDTNGAVVESMNKLGHTLSFVNYGVALSSIKRVANNYAPNHKLALALFNTNCRELKLAAVYIAEPDLVTPEMMREWSSAFSLIEVLENSCSMLFSKSECAAEIALEWIDTMPYAALLILSRRLVRGYNPQEYNIYLALLYKIVPFDDDDKYFELKCRFLAYLNKVVPLPNIELSSKVLNEMSWYM